MHTRSTITAALCAALVVLPGGAMAATADTSPGTATDRLQGVLREVVVEAPPDERHLEEPARERVAFTDEGIVAVPDDVAPDATSGDTLTLTVEETRSGSLVARGGAVVQEAAAAEAVVPVTRQVYVAIASPAGMTPQQNLNTVASVTAMVAEASAYWSSQTNGAVTFEVAGGIEAYQSVHSCENFVAMWGEADQKLFDAGLDAWGAEKHLMVVLPDGSWDPNLPYGCPFGIASLGEPGVPGNALTVSDTYTSLYAHELGHNIGLDHSGALHCTTQDATHLYADDYYAEWPTSCVQEEYGDVLDVMGYSGPTYGEGNLNAAHIHDLGLTPTATKNITTNGVQQVTIAPLSAPVTSLRTVRVTDSTGKGYFVEYRTNSGRDSVALLNPDQPQLGVRVLRDTPGRPTGSLLLDATPTGTYDYKSALTTGKVFVNANRSVGVRVDSTSSSGATLTVVRGTAVRGPATASVPTVPLTRTVSTKTVVTSMVKTVLGHPVANWQATLQVKRKGSTTWSNVATATTNSKGVATFTYANGLSGTYRVVTKGTATTPSRISVTRSTTTVAKASLAGLPSSVGLGTTLKTSGTVAMLPTRVVYLQGSRDGGAWTNLMRVPVGSTSTSVAASWKPTARGTWKLRYGVAGDTSGRWVTGYSEVRTVKVT